MKLSALTIKPIVVLGLIVQATQSNGVAAPSETGVTGNVNALSNSLGMQFVPVPNTDVLFSVWETRVQDFNSFAYEAGHRLKKPELPQESNHPAVNVTWDQANAFCLWLTRRERDRGSIGRDREYRLPRDLEWSLANGIDEDLSTVGATPRRRHGMITGLYPWGRAWPPQPDSGNFARTNARDGYNFTSPVGEFSPNEFGIHDLAGNVSEWCLDKYDPDRIERTLRGSSWNARVIRNQQEISRRQNAAPSYVAEHIGFRCVLAPVEHVSATDVSAPDAPWQNSIGMQFLPAGESEVYWSVHETRWKDFLRYTRARGKVGATRYESSRLGEKPMVNVTWKEANEFCEWLTRHDIQAGRIAPGARYRLPTAAEWDAVFENRYIKARTEGMAGRTSRNEHGLSESGANLFEWMQDGPSGSDETRVIRGGICYLRVPAGKPEIPVEPQIAPPPNITDPPALPSRRRSIDVINMNVGEKFPLIYPALLKAMFGGPPSFVDQQRAYPYRHRNWQMNNIYNQRNWRLQHEPGIRQWKKDRALAILEWKQNWQKKYDELTSRALEEMAELSVKPESRHGRIGFRCVLDTGRQGMIAAR